MKTILHFTDRNELKLLNHHILGLAHLITYTVPCMNGDYEDRVVVYKNHAGIQGGEISHSQLKILQDCVLNDKPQPEFMKTYVPKFPIGYKYGHENGTNWIKEIIGFGIGSDGISPTYKSKFINKVGDSEEYAHFVDERYGKLLELIKPHLEYLGTINTPYVPKFKAGDIIISKNGEHSLEFSIGDAGVRMYYGKLHYVILGDFHECSNIDKKYKLKTPPVAWEG